MMKVTKYYTVPRQKPKVLHDGPEADDIQDYDGLSSHSFRAFVCWRYASRCCHRRSQCRAHLTVEPSSSLPLPAVLTAPIRLDVVRQVHSKFKLFS